MEERKSLGAISSDLIEKGHHERNPQEYMRNMLENYDTNLEECVERYKKHFSSDFYVVVLTKKERLLKNVLRSFFFSRFSCPTPDYDQAVYSYDFLQDRLELLWVIPSKDTCELLRDNAAIVVPLEWELLRFVLEFYDDTLMLKCKKLNGEELKSDKLTR